MAGRLQHGVARRGPRAGSVLVISLFVLAASAHDVAWAQQDAATEPLGVMEQPRPEYDATGMTLGDWTILPALVETVSYDDNVFRLPETRTSDWFLETTPGVQVRRSWATSQFGLSASADNYTYARLHRLDLTDWTIAAADQTALGKFLGLTVSAYFGEYHEGFESADVLGFQRAQTRFYRAHVDALANYQPGDWALTAAATYDGYSWMPTALLDGSQVGNKDRNETLFAPYIRLSYNFTPGYQLFARASYDSRNFATAVDRFGIARSSSGYHFNGGIAVALGQTLRGEAFAGTLEQNFAAAGEVGRNISEFDYGADFSWYASPALTLHFVATRSISDVILPGVLGSDDQSARLSADWLLRDNLIVRGAVAFTDSQLLGTPRTDKYPSAALTFRYLVNKAVAAEVGFTYTGRRSDEATIDYDDRIVSVGLDLHL